MVDIHSHILPGIDDGSKSMEESLEMLKLAAATGTTDIVATPHANSEYSFDPQVITELFTELSDKSKEFITVHRGCDFHLNFDNLQDALENPTKYTINNNRYLMVELPDLTALSAMRSALNRLLDVRITPIITHPERNPSLQSSRDELAGWVQDGCLVQITAQSLTGRFGTTAQKFSESLLQADLVHFVASDAHDCVNRPPDMTPAYKAISTRWGAEKADTLFTHNPSAALWGEPIFALPKPAKKSRLFYFWK